MVTVMELAKMDAEHRVAATVLVLRQEVVEGAELLVPEIAAQHVPVNAKMTVTKHVPALALEHVTIHVLTVAQVDVIIHVRGLVLVDARIRVRAVEALALTIVRDALAAVLVVVLVPVVLLALEHVLVAMDVVTNALPHVSNPAPDVLVAVHAEHHVGQAVNPLVVILVPELAVMGVLIHAEHAVLLVQQAVLQIAEPLARVPVMEA